MKFFITLGPGLLTLCLQLARISPDSKLLVSGVLGRILHT